MDGPDIKLLIQTKIIDYTEVKGKSLVTWYKVTFTVCRENDCFLLDCPTPRYITN